MNSIMDKVEVINFMDVNKQKIIREKDDVKYAMDFAKCYIEEEMELDILEVENGRFGGVVVASGKTEITETLNIKVVIEEKCTPQDKDIWPKLKHSSVAHLLDKEYLPWIHSYIFISEKHPLNLEAYQTSAQFRQNKDACNLTRKLLLDVLNGIVYLHDKKISHLNITSENIWITEEQTAVIGNFYTLNTVEFIPDEDEVPFHFGPPELCVRKWQNLVTGAAHDVWCYGLLAMEIFTKGYMKEMKGFPLWNLNIYPALWKILQKNTFKKLCTETFKRCEMTKDDVNTMFNILHTCLKISPSVRPPAKELLKHKYFAQNGGFLAKEDAVWIKKVKAPMSTWLSLLNSASSGSETNFLQPTEQTALNRNPDHDVKETFKERYGYENLAFCNNVYENYPDYRRENEVYDNPPLCNSEQKDPYCYENLAFLNNVYENDPDYRRENEVYDNPPLYNSEHSGANTEELMKIEKGKTNNKYSIGKVTEWFRTKTKKARKFFLFRKKN